MKRAASAGILGVCVAASAAAVGSCGHHDEPAPVFLDRAAMMNPETCRSCHADHVREWSGSMHAYASDDPLFLAMNARGQRETGNALGTFCVQCHAPLAVREGATKDGLNLASLDRSLKGVTCFFCHTATDVGDAHDNGVHLANDLTMRAGIGNPTENSAHRSTRSALHDRERPGAAALCGSCHDARTPAGVDVARTFAEWRGSLFAHDVPGTLITCSGCHMPGHDGLAAQAPNVSVRRVHDHSMPGLDRATSPFAETDAQAAAVKAFLDPSLVAKLCVAPKDGGTHIEYTLDDAFAGHAFPSGAAYHRRVWAEVHAFVGGSEVLVSGVVPSDASVASRAATDATLWLLGDQLRDKAGAPTEMLWSAARYESAFLPYATTNDRTNPAYYHAVVHTYDAAPRDVDRVTAIVHVRAVDLDTIDDLIASGDLNAADRAKVTTLDIAGTKLEWTSALGPSCVP